MTIEWTFKSVGYQTSEFTFGSKVIRFIGVSPLTTVLIYEKTLEGWSPVGISWETLRSLETYHETHYIQTGT